MSYRSVTETTLSVVPLFTTAEAKSYLKVDTADDDTIIDNLVKAATQSCQIYTNCYFIDTVLTQYADDWNGTKQLYKSPVSSITHIKYYDTDDSLQTWASSNYILDDSSKPARIALALNASYPNTASRINAIEVKYTVGFGAASTDVPDGIKQAVLLTLANWYENRQSVITGRTATELPLSSQYLLDQYKIQVC